MLNNIERGSSQKTSIQHKVSYNGYYNVKNDLRNPPEKVDVKGAL